MPSSEIFHGENYHGEDYRDEKHPDETPRAMKRYAQRPMGAWCSGFLQAWRRAPRWRDGTAAGASLRPRALRALGVLGVLVGVIAMFPTAAGAYPCDTVDTCIPQLRYGETRALREVAAQFLGERSNPKGLPALVAALEQDRGEFVRVKAAEALGRIGTPEAVKPLTRALSGARRDPRDLVRRRAAEALGNLETKDGRAALLDALARDPAWPVRAASAWSLSLSPPTGVIVEAIGLSLRRDPRREVRLVTARALARMKSPRAAAALIEALEKETLPEVKAAVAKAMIEIDSKTVGLALLLALSEDAGRGVRRQAAESLGRRKLETAVGGLVRTLRADQAIEVRTEAATALGRIGGKEARAALEYFAKNSQFPKILLAAQNALDVFPPEKKQAPEPKTTKR